MKKILILLSVITLFSCSSEKDKRTWTEDEELDSTEIAKSSISYEIDEEDYDSPESIKKTENSITDIKKHIEEVNSPDKLMEYIEEYETELVQTEYRISRASDSEERSKLESSLNEIKRDYEIKKNEYSMPANGIVQNINNLKERLNKCSSLKEFNNIVDPRYSFFKNLPKIHSIVAEENRKSEVRELASELRAIFLQKADEYGVEIR